MDSSNKSSCIYKYLVISFLIIIVLLSLINYHVTTQETPNYLYMDSLNLDQHLIAQSSNWASKKIVFLGSSAVAGSNVPAQSTTVDFFNEMSAKNQEQTPRQSPYFAFNLATLQANILDSLIYLRMSLKYSPAIIILGINPGSFPANLASKLSHEKIAVAADLLDDTLIKEIAYDRLRKADFSPLVSRYLKKELPSKYHIEFNGWIYYLRDTLFGPRLNNNLFGAHGQGIDHVLAPENPGKKLICQFKKLAQEKQIKLFVYLEPIYRPTEVYGENHFQQYLQQIKEILNKEKIVFYDYTALIPSTHQYFIDFIHMRPLAYQMVAQQLYADLRGHLK